jgi:colanic acid/amylovoran biosynthesis glycosyltransferase
MKIAIYSGVVPTTEFIERFINGLASNGIHLYIFGNRSTKMKATPNISYYTYSNKLSKLFRIIKYSILLTVFNAKGKKRLDEFIINREKSPWLLKVKYYPVLYHRPDVFHIQWAKSIDDWQWVQDFGIKLVLSLRGTHITISPVGDRHWQDVYNQLFQRIDGFHSVSKSLVEKALEYGADSSKVKVIYSGLNLNEIIFSSELKSSQTLEILSVGRSHWTKGYVDAMDAMKILKNKNINFHYTIIGVEEDEELIFQRAQLDLKKEVTFKGKMSFKNVLKEMENANLLLLSSVEEGIANVVLEAMAVGTLVVSTNCGGMKEVINHNKNGILVPTRNPAIIASAIDNVRNLSLYEYQNITIEARNTIEKQHNINKMLCDMQDLYNSVLNSEL